MTKYLPAGMSLNSAQRAEAERERAHIAAMLECGGPTIVRAAAIGRIMAIGAGGAVDKDGSRARSDNYRDATDDLPVWTITEAARRWNRAEVTAADIGKTPNFDFAPQPPILRMICLRVAKPYRDALNAIDDLLAAEPLEKILRPVKMRPPLDGKTYAELHPEPKRDPLDVEAVRAAGRAERQQPETEGAE